VIYDDDPVAGRTDIPDGVRLGPAAEPEGCSGKANAMMVGMKTAEVDRIIWTDDDFHHGPDWLATLTADHERHGPVSEVSYFFGRDPLAVLLPMLASAGTLGIYLLNQIWGGAVAFKRDEIESTFFDELRRTISDDALLMEHLQVTTARLTYLVPVGGTVRKTVERILRWTKITWRHDPVAVAGIGLALLLALAGAVLFPLHAVVVLTVFHLAVKEVLDVRRWRALLAYPAVFVFVPLIPYALGRRTLVSGGRRYRWRSKFDVKIIE